MTKQSAIFPKMPNKADRRPILITGGAGFIGTNLAHRLLSNGEQVIVFDNLSRPGVERNFRWLQQTHGNAVKAIIGDIRDYRVLRNAIAQVRQIYHLAAQVAVTTSIENPFDDFSVNVEGTMNILECLRTMPKPPSLVITSTNKVYGALWDIALKEKTNRYEPMDLHLKNCGVDETQALDFYSPYGCSKGAADQYTVDYVRTYGIEAVVFRMSCIYGPHQLGTEDQGWVAYFLLCALMNKEIILYGNGKQVRDILFIDDLVDALLKAQENMKKISGEVFNIGGGPLQSVSLVELLSNMRQFYGYLPSVNYAPWRTGDQKYYVSNTAKFLHATGWQPQTGITDGLNRLNEWLFKIQSGKKYPVLRKENVA